MNRFYISKTIMTLPLLCILGLSHIAQADVIPHRTSAAPLSEGYKFTESTITLNGQTVVAKAARFVSSNTSYVSLYDAQLLINKILGTTSKSGDIWNGINKSWNITYGGGSAHLIPNSHGNATFEINGKVVIHAPIIVTQPKGDPQPTTFVPIWYVQQVINQLIHGTDKWDGSTSPATWVVGKVKSSSSSNAATEWTPSEPWPKGTGQQGTADPPGSNWGTGN